MTYYFVSYDLTAPGQNYAGIEEAICEHGRAVKLLETFWFLKSETDIDELVADLSSILDESDKLMVVEASDARSTHLPKAIATQMQILWKSGIQ